MPLEFKKATRQQARLRMALIGPAGSGKTFTALRIATHLGGPIALLDTERGSASKYAGEQLPEGIKFDFDVIEPDSFGPETYVEVIRAAEAGGYKVLIIDSLSHAWIGKDGALERVDKAAKREKGNSFSGWREVTPLHNQMVDAIIGSRLHVIATMRSKMEYVVEKDPATGKSVPRKIGLQPVQRDGLEYEFDLIADLDQDNNLIVGKTRCSALSGAVIPKAGREIAEKLKAWLTDGAPEPTEEELFENLEADIRKAAKILGRTEAHLTDYARRRWQVTGVWTELPLPKMRELLQFLKTKIDQEAAQTTAV